MKKFILLILAIITVFSLISCTENKVSDEPRGASNDEISTDVIHSKTKEPLPSEKTTEPEKTPSASITAEPEETPTNTTTQEEPDDVILRKYEGIWLDKNTSEKSEGTQSDDLVITEIYADCFFADCVIPLPYKIKINGSISKDWCVNDQVYVTYDNVYMDEDNKKIEGDLKEIKKSTLELDPDVCYKPVIYLYPEKETDISVKLDLNGEFICTYPEYKNGWEITAAPDGTLTDRKGQTYNYLYWEGLLNTDWNMSKGFCIKGENTAEFLETALDKLGLTRREANEFIVYWLPLMQNNPYNIISFQTDAYTNAAELGITPAPDTVIRVFMTYKASDNYVAIDEQQLISPDRDGFVAVEWGGTEIK